MRFSFLFFMFFSSCYAVNLPVRWTVEARHPLPKHASVVMVKTRDDVKSCTHYLRLKKEGYKTDDLGLTSPKSMGFASPEAKHCDHYFDVARQTDALPLMMTSPKITATSCKQYLKLVKSGYAPSNNMQLALATFFDRSCMLAVYKKRAQPAKRSYVRGFKINRDWKFLPAALVFPSLGDKEGPSGTVIRAWPDTHVIASGRPPFSMHLQSKKAGMAASLAVLGWGDFNHDGYDDLLLGVDNHTLMGTFHSYHVYVLTASTAALPFQYRVAFAG